MKLTDLPSQRRIPSQHRRGLAVIAMVLVLGGLALALLTLAGQTAIQGKKFQSAYMDNQQCNELLEYGERILKMRIIESTDYSGETIPLEIPWSATRSNGSIPNFGEIAIHRIANPDNANPVNANLDNANTWRITVNCGQRSSARFEAAKSIRLSR
ncbi:MAG: hypothetical protein WCK15_07270 [Pirellula sp.]